MNLNRQQYAIKALGKIEGFKNDIQMLSATLDLARLWRPGLVLKKQCEETLRLITKLEKRFDFKLIVTLIGPSGSGKSTLLNALAGVDDLSTIGNDRPTTRNLIALCREKSDADQLIDHFGDKNVQIRSNYQAVSLDQLIFMDTPDTDSTELEKHIPMVNAAIEQSDVLICVFNSENPKRKDYVDFLSPYIRRFHGESLLCVMNKCERQDEHELKEMIVPEFLTYIKDAWERPVDRVLCISARRNLKNPNWDPKAVPKHDFDEFEELKKIVFGRFTSEGFAVDRRLENAESLKDFVINEIRTEVEKDRQTLMAVRQNIIESEKNAINSSLMSFKTNNPKQLIGVNVLLYQKLSQRWLGPVGWLIALWARILIFGSGMVAMFRFGNPIRQLLGIASSIWHYKESKIAIAETEKTERVDNALRDYRFVIMRTWPDIAESLVKSRFDSSVRQIETVFPERSTLSETLSSVWNDTLDSAIEEFSAKLSGLKLQFIFNVPVIVILGYVGWITAKNFFYGKYLNSDFFIHAFLTIGIVLFLCFFIFQVCVRLAAGTERITGKAFENVKARTEQFQVGTMNPLVKQLDILLAKL